MEELAASGFVLFGGPLAGSERGDHLRVLLIVNAESEEEIHRRLADYPWVPTRHLVTTTMEPWAIFAGSARLPAAAVA